jgi:hypothetical protein
MSYIFVISRSFAKTTNYIYNPIKKSTFLLSGIYVSRDIYTKSSDIYKTTKNKNKTLIKATDLLLWHLCGTILFPNFFVNKIIDKTKEKIFIRPNFKNNIPFIKYIPIFVGLCSIPIILKPIDYLTDNVLDMTIRKIY